MHVHVAESLSWQGAGTHVVMSHAEHSLIQAGLARLLLSVSCI